MSSTLTGTPGRLKCDGSGRAAELADRRPRRAQTCTNTIALPRDEVIETLPQLLLFWTCLRSARCPGAQAPGFPLRHEPGGWALCVFFSVVFRGPAAPAPGLSPWLVPGGWARWVSFPSHSGVQVHRHLGFHPGSCRGDGHDAIFFYVTSRVQAHRRLGFSQGSCRWDGLGICFFSIASQAHRHLGILPG
jgi:hypothetical protein